jgi:hypothetical protein
MFDMLLSFITKLYLLQFLSLVLKQLNRNVSRILDFAHPILKQDRHCVYNEKLWCICVTIVAVAVAEYILIVFDLHLAVTSVNVFIVATEVQHWVPLALLSSYKMFCTAVDNVNVLRSWTCKGTDIFVQIYPNLEFDRCS